MSVYLIDPGRTHRYQRPRWPYRLNGDSHQARGLVAWWPLDEGSPRDHGTSQQIHTLTASGATPRGAANPIGHGWSFTGASSHYLTVPVAAITAYPFTLSCWVKMPEPGSGTGHTLLGCGNSAGSGSDVFAIDVLGGATDVVRALAGGSGSNLQAVSSTRQIPFNEWFLACGVFNTSTDVRVFMNAFKTTGSPSRVATGLNCTVLGRLENLNGSDVNYLTGELADARVYNRVLQDWEVLALYALDTRWELYEVPTRLVYFDVTVGGGFVPFPRPRGLEGGMGSMTGGMA